MNNKIYGFDKFFEKKLELSDLKSDKTRGDTLVKKLKNKEDLELDSGGVVKIDRMMDPDIDGAWVEPDVAVNNLVGDDGGFDGDKATNYFKNMKPKAERTNKYKGNVYVPVLKDKNGTEYLLTDLKKDINFGSTGAGLRIREHESIQMIFLAMRLSQNTDFPEPIKEQKGERKKYYYPEMADILSTFVGTASFKFGNISVNTAPGFKVTQEICDHYSSDQSWLSTFANVPNKLLNQKDSKGKLIFGSNRGYTIFHVSSKDAQSIPNVIFNRFKELSKGGDFKSVKPLGMSFSRLPYPTDSTKYGRSFDRASKEEIEFSKYCPADIYVVDTNSIADLIGGISSCDDILELNTYLNDSFNDRQILPISLKRVGPSPNSANIIVNAEEGMSLPVFDVKSFRLSADIDKGIGSKIMTNSEWIHDGEKIERERNLTLDSPNTAKNSNIDGEIDGKWARHGKISLLWIKKFIEGSNFYQKLEDRFDIRIMEWSELQKLNLEQLKEMLRSVQQEIVELKSDIRIEIKFDLGGKEIGGIERKLISKIQSLQVIRALVMIDKFDDDDKEVDNIVSKMLLYALSIQNPGFSSPKYIRVI
jgi:hypothetical protein